MIRSSHFRNLCQSVSDLWAWLQTWLDDKGGVHGYIVHHHRDNLNILSPDTWTQATCILGLLRIYQNTQQEKWFETSLKLCGYLVDTYLRNLHVYRNSNHEHKPLGRPGLIDNAIASYALLEVSREGKKIGYDWQAYYSVAKDNLENFLLQFWDDSVGALLSPAHDVPQHIHNMNSVAIMALISLAELENNECYTEKYAEKIGRFIVACQVKKGERSGAYPYRDTVKNYITLYSLVTCMGLLTLHRKTKSSDHLVSVEKAIEHLVHFLDQETGLICHYHRHGYPQWIPDTLLLILNLNWLKNEGREVPVNTSEILAKVLSRQYKNGGFPLSVGFEDLWYQKGCPSRPEIRRWRDLLPTPNWNAWNFWALTELLPERARIGKPKIAYPLVIDTDVEEDEGPYQIIEDQNKVVFMSKTENKPFGIFRKKNEVADLCLMKERDECWRTHEALKKYPKLVRRSILTIPKLL